MSLEHLWGDIVRDVALVQHLQEKLPTQSLWGRVACLRVPKVPQDLLKRLNKLEHVTASHFLHSCQGLRLPFYYQATPLNSKRVLVHGGKHLENENLYHRILKIQQAVPHIATISR